MPSRAPVESAPATTTNPTVIEIRAPRMTRLNTSRPRLSVPIQWCADGVSRRAPRSSSSGPVGAICAAKIAMSVKNRIMIRPTRALALAQNRRAAMRTAERPPPPRRGTATATAVMPWVCSGVADAGIEEGIQHVDDEVDEHEQQRKQENARENHRIIAKQDRVVHEPADARPRENGLRQDRAGQKRAELESDDGHHGQQRV